jgi:GT2 family glycosyltransferase
MTAEADSHEGTRVAICVPTFRRPESLALLLGRLGELESSAELRVFVVDNDSERTAESVVRGVHIPIPVVYAVEPKPGIVAARNRLIAEAKNWQPDYVAFIDDDEWPETSWVDNLLLTAQRYDAALVGGPVLPTYDDAIPAWIRNGHFFERPRWGTGSVIETWGTCNLLVRWSDLVEVGAYFDERFRVTGGSDTHFVGQFGRRGKTVVWCDEAIVYEGVPATRASVRWLTARAFRTAASYTVSEIALGASLRWRARRVLRMTARFVVGALLLMPSVLRGRAATLSAIRHCAGGVGGILGIAGYAYGEYKRP